MKTKKDIFEMPKIMYIYMIMVTLTMTLCVILVKDNTIAISLEGNSNVVETTFVELINDDLNSNEDEIIEDEYVFEANESKDEEISLLNVNICKVQKVNTSINEDKSQNTISNLANTVSVSVDGNEVVGVSTNESIKTSEYIEPKKQTTLKKYNWQVSIPKINVIAPIEEGTDQELLNRAVGHFAHTSNWDGNVGICAHNGGFAVNYFAEVRYLNIGDEIEYRMGNQVRIYEVTLKTVIASTDWSYLEPTQENILTLITCANDYNMAYRLCVQAKEKK